MKNKYSLSSKLILITFLIGIVNLFLYDYESTQETIIFIFILSLRYILFILIKRRFEWSKYLLVLIIIRSVYRLWIVMGDIDINPVTKINLTLQVIISLLAFVILIVFPKLKEWVSDKRGYITPPRISNPQH